MTQTQTRYGAFTHEELETMQVALAGTIDSILTCAADPTHEVCRNPDAANAAADMLQVAGKLVFELDDALGEPHPPVEYLDTTVERVRARAIVDLLGEHGG